MQNEQKRKAMDAITNKETQTQVRAFRGKTDPAVGGAVPGPRSGPAVSPVLKGMKREVMDAVASVETLGQIGWLKVAGGAAMYAAHIRQVDRSNMREIQQQRTPPTRNRLERE